MTTGGDCGRCGKWFETQCYDDQGYGDCPECIEKLKAEQPTPQNREADMPDELFALKANSRGVVILSNAPAATRYTRADLANKPALDAEVEEAIEYFRERIYDGDMSEREAIKLETLIRAASAVQEVTVEELDDFMDEAMRNNTDLEHMERFLTSRDFGKILQKKYPNGLKLVKEKS